MSDRGGQAPVLVLGPLLRYVGETAATIWVETDRACQVRILDHEVATFEVAGHHYALALIEGLQPGQSLRIPGQPGRDRVLAGTGHQASRPA